MSIIYEPTVGTTGPLDDARTQLREAATILGIDDGLFDMLATPRREVTVSVPLRRDNGDTELLIGHRSSTTSPAVRRRAACATHPTSPSTRSAHSRCG